MIDESMDKEAMAQHATPYEFRSKPAGQRLMIMIAGVLFNFLLALFIYSMVLYTLSLIHILYLFSSLSGRLIPVIYMGGINVSSLNWDGLNDSIPLMVPI